MPHDRTADAESVLFNDMPAYDPALALDEAEAGRWEALIALRMEVNRALEAARAEKRIGKSLEAKVTLHLSTQYAAVKGEDPAFLADLFIVSAVELGPDAAGEEPTVEVAALDAPKCARCWKFDPHVGQAPEHPELCPRCAAVVKKLDL